MRISLASPSLEGSLRSLWQRVFHDESDYLDLFFSHCFYPEHTVVAAENDTVLSALYLLPMTVRIKEKRFPAAYIYAVATLPEAQGRGLSSRVLEETHRMLKANGTALSLLVPAEKSLFDFYGARGFETLFYRRTAEKTVTAAEPLVLKKNALPELRMVREAFFSDCTVFGSYDPDALFYREAENAFLGGETLAFQSEGKTGYAVCTPLSDCLLIRELAAEPTDRVLFSLARHFQKDRVRFSLAGSSLDEPFAMASWYGEKPDFSKEKTSLTLALD